MIINALISWLMKKRIHQIDLFIKYPHDVQAEWLKRLNNAGMNTEFGLKYDFKSIRNKETFRDRVPVSDYDDVKPYIMRLMKGESNLLWNSDIRWFAKSSGTTSDKSKFIPVSAESMEECHYKGGKDMLSFYCNNFPDTNIFTGKGLSMGGSHSVVPVNNEAYYGDISAIIIQNLPFWAEFIRTPDLSIALMDDWEAKIDKMAIATMQEDVTNMMGVPSWTLVLLRRILDISGKNNICEVWENLELFIHGAVNFGPYREQFKALIPSTGMNYMETYNASEGFFGIEDVPGSGELLLMLDYGIYYEFMPMGELGKDNPRTLLLEEVTTGVNYAIIISTNSGLWRYLIGDTVKFTSLNPYRIRITGRTKHFINAFGEELIIDNAQHALETACAKTNASIHEYTACPIYFSENEKGGHEWLIEFNREPENIDYFTEVLDNALKAQNSDYEAKRYKDMALGIPKLKKVPRGTFYNWLKSKGKLGGQYKVPRLSNNRTYVEEILDLVDRTGI